MGIRRMALVAFPVLIAAGCAAVQQTDTADAERTLAAAGFQMKFATTPEQMAKVQSLPQRKLTPTTSPQGEPRFVYADATGCKCIYVGTQAAYDRYQKSAVNQRIEASDVAATLNWPTWGAWGPWW